jgi:SAM-dependent methyltransferase
VTRTNTRGRPFRHTAAATFGLGSPATSSVPALNGSIRRYSRDVPDSDHVESARAVYDAAASTYVAFVGTEISPRTEGAVDRSILVAFSELVQDGPAGSVADIGCGPGRVAAFLARRGLDVVGIDVSEELLSVARNAHPHIRFELGQLEALPIETKVLAGAVCWYSIIYTPPDRLGGAFHELIRVLHPGGLVMFGFQAGDGEAVDRATALGTQTSLTTHMHSPQAVADQLQGSGFTIQATVTRAPMLAHEVSPQCFIIACRPPNGETAGGRGRH